jgi:ATP-dependent DNA helicase Q4
MKRLNVRLSFSTQPSRRITLIGGKNEIVAKIIKEEEFLLAEVFPASTASTIPIVSEKESVALENDGDGISLSDSDDEGDDCVSLGSADSSNESTKPHLAVPVTITTPLFESDMSERVTDVLHKCFGFDSLRASQSWAIERCTRGQNSLVIMPTGAGKSLCYQIPALLLEGITIVVSPLIALMQDQIKKLPACLPAACLSGGLTAQETATLLVDLKRGFIKVLFVSPERLCTHSFRQLMKDLRSSPLRTHRISLLCVDEAHCMSSWSYNFRPSFLRIRREIAHMNPHSILALTATAPPYIQSDILRHLNIPSDGLNITRYKRDNLKLHASVPLNDEHKRRMVIDIFKKSADVSDGIKDEAKMPSILYVWRRADADSYCDFLKSHGLKALSYHAGMDTEARRKVQEQFDRGAVDIITATTSFGMGVDKADVRRVVHCGLPKSIEAYLQVGRVYVL